MPRRVSARGQPEEESPPTQSVSQQVKFLDSLTQLRTNWKWAAFSQFFFTFNHLFAMNDVSLNAIEEDLVHGSNIVLPRIMQRLLYTVSYDRKVSLNNWQTALRKQYRKRDPAANPIGPEPRVEEPEQPSSPAAEEEAEIPQETADGQPEEEQEENKAGPSVEPDDDGDKMPESTRASTLERGFSLGASVQGQSFQPSEPDSIRAKQSSVGDEMGEQAESKNWLDLPMLVKLDSMHILTEWQFQNPMRFRTLMRSDDENASWRIEPIGYDSKKNAYWLIGADRLWLQRPTPRPSRPRTASNTAASLKRKRGGTTTAKAASKGKGRAAPAPTAKRPRIQEEEPASAGTGRSRAAKAQAKVKLDAQAKELAELNRQAAARARADAGLRTSARGSPAKKAPLPRGTRLSARLRGQDDEEEWQAVPQEWLNEGEGSGSNVNGKKGGKTGLESDGSEVSDLTELSEENGIKGEGEDGDVEAEEQPVNGEEAPVDDRGLEEQPVLPKGFVEWETICVTLHEWEHIAEPFAKATHYTERALYKVLVNNIVPVVTEELREIERKQKLSVAITQRKRSSRLLLRQSEREEVEAAERKRQEEDERNSRAKRQEARAKKEEADRERRELARELRRREREEKEGREKVAEANGEATIAVGSDMQVDVVGDGAIADATTTKYHTRHPRQNAATLHSGKNGHSMPKAGGSGSRTPLGEDWELDCEICHRRGINLDDGTPMMSCGLCSKWQHIACHDLADQQAGRKRRNWDRVEFFCSQCRAKKAATSRPPQQPHMPTTGMGQIQTNNPYMTHSIASLAHASQYMNSNYPSPAVNGSAQYGREPQVSNARSAVPARGMPQQHQPGPHPVQAHQQHQPYAAPISFSHYQPQQRGFSSTTEPLYGPSSHTQPYGHPSTHSQYPQYPVMNGGGQSYQQTSQARWNLNNTSSQRSTSEHSTAVPAPHHTGGDINPSRGAAGPYHGHSPLPAQAPMQWQQAHHHSPPAVAAHTAAPQHPTQFRYHATSYQPAPS